MRTVNTSTHWSKQIFSDKIIQQIKWYFNHQALDNQPNIKSLLARVQASPKSKQKLRSAGSSNCSLRGPERQSPVSVQLFPLYQHLVLIIFLTLPKNSGLDH